MLSITGCLYMVEATEVRTAQVLTQLSAQANPQATAPLSLNMSGWAAMDATGRSAASDGSQGSQDRSASDLGTSSSGTGSQERSMGAISGWQAIAADVSASIC